MYCRGDNMRIDRDNLLESILESLSGIDYIKPDDIPNISLYMDQVTTFMDRQLERSKRYEDDKILTKTMINNYTKNHLLPPPDKKKYSREHILTLIFIYYFKNILSIKDIDTLLNPLTNNHFSSQDGLSLQDIYTEVFQMEKENVESIKKDIEKKFNIAAETFSDADEEEKDFLQLYSFICELCFDVYVKRQIIERVIDTLPEPEHKKEKKK